MRKKDRTIFKIHNILLLLSCIILLASTNITSWAQENNSQPNNSGTCCSSLDISTLMLEVPCFSIGENAYSLSLSYSGGLLFKLEQTVPLNNSPCSTACCGNYDLATGLISLPCVLAGESSLWTTFSLIVDNDGIFLNLLDYGLNPSSSAAEIKEITLDTSQDSSSFFSFVTDKYADTNTYDIFAEPWCTAPLRLCGHFVLLGNKALENVSASDIPAPSVFPAEIYCEDLPVGNTCIFKNTDGSYTAATIASHANPDSCTHIIKLRYKTLNSSDNSCNVIEPQPQQHAVGDALWVHNVPVDDKELWIAESPLSIGKDGSIYYSASGGQANWQASRIYAINKTDGSLKWKTGPLATWHLNSDIVVGDDGTIYALSYTKLYSIDPAAGVFNWEWEVPEKIGDNYTYGELGGLALSNNGDLIFKSNGSGSYYRALYCVGSNGQTKWHHFIGADGTPVTIGYDGNIYDFGHEMLRDKNNQPYYQNYLYAYNPNTGNEVWKVPAVSSNSYSNNIAVADNGDLIWRNNDKLVRSDPADGHTIWQVDAQSNYDNKVIDPNGLVYLYDQWAGTAVFDPQTGDIKESRINITSWPAIDSLGRLCGIMGSDVHLSVNNTAGTLVWESKIDGFYGATIAISSGKIVYIANGKKVYALQGDAAPAQSGWPRFSHDNRNTFNVNKY